ncbi:hypothetical protein TDB9533_00193 [Thalassocella blandensis]|nr:hypothetical protein TDB9533_00193 [Thalassocella blandensis]
MLKLMNKGILVALAIFSAQAFAEHVSFRASGFVPAYSDAPPVPETFYYIDCEFEYNLIGGTEIEFDSFQMKIGQTVLGVDDIGAMYSTATNSLVGGIENAVNGMKYGTDDFWFYFNPQTQEVSYFRFTTSEVEHSIYRATTIDYNIGGSVELVLDEEEGFYVPSEGGRVDYDASLKNFEPGEMLGQWSVLTMPNGDEFPVHKLRDRQVTGWDGTVQFNRNHLNIPEWFDDGEYKLTWYLANTDTLNRTKGSMTFEKGEEALQDKQALQNIYNALDVELKQNALEEMKIVVEDGIARLIEQ